MQPSWNLTSAPPQTTPEPIWAETPKLSAVGEKTLNKLLPGLSRDNYLIKGGEANVRSQILIIAPRVWLVSGRSPLSQGFKWKLKGKRSA